ncbi:MAG: mechanosensitive ion channel [Acidobacteriota bacterium]|nr:MAG: mechanosensitive ion channel [Acidobacteriota bacterium]
MNIIAALAMISSFDWSWAAMEVVAEEPSRSTWLESFPRVSDLFGTLSTHRLLFSALILSATYLLTVLLKRLVHHMVSERVRYSAGMRKLLPVLNLALWVIASWIVLIVLIGESPIAVILMAAIAAIAIAAASFRFLQDVVGSVVIVFERPFKIGDRVNVGDREGEVIHIGLRSFQISTLDGSITVIPNSEVLRNSVTNTSHGARESQVTVDIALPQGFDLNEAKRIASEAAFVSPFTFLGKPVEVEIDQSKRLDADLVVRVKAYVFDAEYASRLRSDLIELTRNGVDEAARIVASNQDENH